MKNSSRLRLSSALITLLLGGCASQVAVQSTSISNKKGSVPASDGIRKALATYLSERPSELLPGHEETGASKTETAYYLVSAGSLRDGEAWHDRIALDKDFRIINAEFGSGSGLDELQRALNAFRKQSSF